MSRNCGGCTLCCKLLPMGYGVQRRKGDVAKMFSLGEFEKPAGQRCPHQRSGRGCAIYSRRPMCCATWNCRWLVNDDTADLHRPDRSHCVIDIMPDFVTLTEESGERVNVEVVCVWVDPHHRDAYKDRTMRDYMARRGEEGIATIIRYSPGEAFVVFPPAMTADGTWKEVGGAVKPEQSQEERLVGVATARRVKV